MQLLWHYMLLSVVFIECYSNMITLPLQTMTEQEMRNEVRRRQIAVPQPQNRNSKDPIKLITGSFLTNVFYTTIKIGSDKKKFKLVIDSTEFLMWVPSSKSGIGFGCGARLHNMYNPDESPSSELMSTTFHRNKSNVVYSGRVYQDHVYVGQYTLNHQAFGVLEYTDSRYYEYAPFDGVFPGGFRPSSDDVFPPINRLKSENDLDKTLYTFYINTTEKKPQSGRFTIGKVDNDMWHAEPQYHGIRMVDSVYVWSITPGMLFVGEQTIFDKRTNAIDLYFETSAPKIYVSESLAYDINTSLGAVKKYFPFPLLEYAWVLPCTSFVKGNTPSIIFEIDDKYYSIQARHLVTKFRIKGALVCVTLVEAHQSVKNIVLGIPFFKSYLTIFDMDDHRIGFVPNDQVYVTSVK